jgi:hypothetical protein
MGGSSGGGSGGGGSAPAIQTQIVREAPGIEERKIGLMDIGLNLGATPVNIPQFQVAQPTALEQQGFQQAGTTGVGAPTVQQGIASLQAGQGATLQALQGPNINQFFNPYQSYVIDEVTRQAQQAQNKLGAQAIGTGAFGGGREGVQQAEIERARLANIGQLQATGFQTAAQLAGQQQQIGLAGGQQLGQMGTQLAGIGAQQQTMGQADIQSLLQAGGVQRQLAQQTLDAQRATELQRAYEPFQRAEFVKNIYAAGPTSQSGITAATTPTVNPLAQTVGTGIGAYSVYQNLQPTKKA